MKIDEPKYPTFDEAEIRLQEFLRSVQWPENVIWISPDNVAVLGQGFIVHPSKDGREKAIEDYKKGIEKDLGILLTAVCRDDHNTYCAVWVPSNPTEAEYALMPDGLKLSVPSLARETKVINGQIKWLLSMLLCTCATSTTCRRTSSPLVAAKNSAARQQSPFSGPEMNNPINWRVYMIRCSDNTLYTGITTDMQRRFCQHAQGSGAKYFRGRQPLEVVYCEDGHSRSSATHREARIKAMTRGEKDLLISSCPAIR